MFTQIAFGIGSLCLGSSVTMAIFFTLAGRKSPGNWVEGCYANFMCLSVFLVGLAFFIVGLVSSI